MSRDNLARLAVAQMLYKELAKVVSTKDPRSLRSQCDEELRSDFAQSGTDRRRIIINGVEVGTLSAKVSKPSVETHVEVTDTDAFDEATLDRHALGEFLVRHREEFAEFMLDEYGELMDGCEVVEHETPGGAFLGTTIRGCTLEKVSEAAGVLFGSEIAALLEGGN